MTDEERWDAFIVELRAYIEEKHLHFEINKKDIHLHKWYASIPCDTDRWNKLENIYL